MTSPEHKKLEEYREIFRKLAYFTAPAAIGQNELPQSILDNLVEHALFLQKTPIQMGEVVKVIKSQFGLNFGLDEIRVSLERLLAKKLVIRNKGNFSLEIRCRASLQKIIDEKIDQENQIFRKLENRIEARDYELTKDEIEQIKSDFQTFLTNFFLLSGAEAVQLIYGNPKEINELVGRAQKKNIFELLPIRNEKLRKIEQKEFCEFVNLLSEQDKLYLQDLLDRSLQYFVITVDKNCEALLTADFESWNLFIDTNFIYNLLGLNGGSQRKNVEGFLDLSKRIKIKLFVSPITLEEFTMSASRARELLLGDKISRKLYRVAGELTGNAILSSYYEAYEQQRISPRDFLAKTDNIKDVLKSYGIEVKNDYSQSIKGTKEFDEMVGKMIALTGKDQNIAEHDTFHYLLILRLRKREGADDTFRTNKSWFLTYDGLLAPFDRELRKSEIPFCIKPYQLRQILHPLFSRTDNFEGVFIDFIAEPAARAFPAVSTDVVMNVLARVTYFEREFGVQNSPELAIKVLTNQHFLNQLHELHAKESGQVKLIDQEIKQIAQISEEVRGVKPTITATKDYWNFVNPLWLIWQCLKRLATWIRKHKLVSVVSGGVVLLGLIATDYTMAWKNLRAIWEFVRRIVGI